MMAGSPVFLGVIVLLSAFPGPSVGGRAMPKLADRKLCADEECSYPISMAVALQDYVAPDCRFLTIHRGQVVYVFSKLKGRGRLFWGGSVQGDYYGDLAARLGYFPSSVVREDQTLKPGKIDVKTDVSVLGADRDREGGPWGCEDGQKCFCLWLPGSVALCAGTNFLPQFSYL
ncbi:melanoma-derived growth regulatory protein isoform X1 [Ailuropoda melanoleuca]|uniref:melanoma-derived growth regulatory protein isoform X1 n=1 Tax=Ailuropoda melanoleuca TaxID=9646 RepID=UPI00059B2188|nr:melanoma-derived growth regulatory protein isoform X1 [Ailuropoda melanoleuca]